MTFPAPPAYGRLNVVLVAHGSRDARSAATVRAIARTVAADRPDVTVHAAFLDFDAPHLAVVLDRIGDAPTLIVPMLLSRAYHARVDIPGIVAAARGDRIEIADVLAAPGPGAELLIAALRERLAERRGVREVGALVLAAAGTRDAAALAAIDDMAAALGAAEGLPCLAGHVSGAGRRLEEAVVAAAAIAGPTRSVGVASYFLAPGVLHDRVVALGSSDNCLSIGQTSRSTTELMISAPIGDSINMVAIVAERIDRCVVARQALV